MPSAAFSEQKLSVVWCRMAMKSEDRPAAPQQPMAVAEIRAALLTWYDQYKRDLPWRRDPRPWPVWVSEIMLQQTRVDSVIGYFNRFMARFPTPSALAAADLDEVLGFWAGLGYYARARNLHRAAKQVVSEHGGVVPDQPEVFRQLAGVGRYTCGAVQSIAFQHQVPILDGNVIRVLTRLGAIEDNPKDKATNDVLWQKAEELAQGERPGDLNQSLMELGALVCLSKSPHCLLCPVSQGCIAREKGIAETLPRKPKRKARPRKEFVAVILRDTAGRICLGRRPLKGLLGGLWALPAMESDGKPDRVTLKNNGFEATGQSAIIEHGFTHQIWEVRAYEATGTPSLDAFESFQFFSVESMSQMGISGPTLKALRAIGVPLAHRRGAGRTTQ